MASIEVMLKNAKIIFWDFDGVIKDSVQAKADAFEKLFEPYGKEVAKKVRDHHEENGGVSRYVKIPIYLSWVDVEQSPAMVETFCQKFSKLVLEAVVNSPWVPGVKNYIEAHSGNQKFVLVTATPQNEIEVILEKLELTKKFTHIYGYPKKKSSVIKEILERYSVSPLESIMVGDADVDLNAANENGVPFLLRMASYNNNLQRTYSGPKFEELHHE